MKDAGSYFGAEKFVILAESTDIHAEEAKRTLFVIGNEHVDIPQKFRPASFRQPFIQGHSKAGPVSKAGLSAGQIRLQKSMEKQTRYR